METQVKLCASRLPYFDLSSMEIYLDGNSLGMATLTIQKRQRHLKVERLATEPPDPPKPKSSLDFLTALREEYRLQQQRDLGQLHFSHLASDWPPPPEENPSDPNPPLEPAPSEA